MSEHGPESFDLRRRAERRLNPDGFTELVPAPGADPARLVYELQVHQVELEFIHQPRGISALCGNQLRKTVGVKAPLRASPQVERLGPVLAHGRSPALRSRSETSN